MTHQARAEETRSNILAAAEICFSRSGYEAASVAVICQQAGVTKGAFYYHFATKQALFLELLNSWLETLDVQFQHIRGEGKSVPHGLVEMAGSMRVIFAESANFLPMFLEFWLHAAREPHIWQMVIEPYRRYQAYFSAFLQEGQAEGSLRPVDTSLAARALLSMAIGLVLQGTIDPQGADWTQTSQESVRLLLEGLQKEAG